MTNASEIAFKTFAADIARVSDVPKVVFPYGVKIVEHDGERMLCPMTPEEYRAFAAKRGFKGDDLLEPSCSYVLGGGCSSQGCYQAHGSCQNVSEGTFHVCRCNY